MKYSRIAAEFYSRVWALREDTLFAMQELIHLQSVEGMKWTPQEIRERIEAANSANGYVPEERKEARFIAFNHEIGLPVGKGGETLMQAANGKRNAAAPGSVAVIPISGVISQRMSLMSSISGAGGTSIEKLTAQFRQALTDTNCKAIVFDVDSPGGSVGGVPELASEIFNARKQKPISAVVNSMCCSAAYWLASAASELVCTPSGQAGSIGVYMTHQDESKALENDGVKITLIKAGKYKAEGNPTEPLSDEARAAFQSMVDDYYGMFVKNVAQNRGTTQAAVRDGYGQGRSLLAQEALKQNLVDRVGTLDDVLGKYGVKPASSMAAESTDEIPSAEGMDPAVRADNSEDDDTCGCDALSGKTCKACQACENENAPPKDTAAAGCGCTCDACKACDGKAEDKAKANSALLNLNRRRRQLHLI